MKTFLTAFFFLLSSFFVYSQNETPKTLVTVKGELTDYLNPIPNHRVVMAVVGQPNFFDTLCIARMYQDYYIYIWSMGKYGALVKNDNGRLKCYGSYSNGNYHIDPEPYTWFIYDTIGTIYQQSGNLDETRYDSIIIGTTVAHYQDNRYSSLLQLNYYDESFIWAQKDSLLLTKIGIHYGKFMDDNDLTELTLLNHFFLDESEMRKNSKNVKKSNDLINL
jgi:hypothetical protein